MLIYAQQNPKPRVLWPVLIALFCLLSLVYSAIVPPFQAPDEMTHVERAYLMGRGQLLLTSQHGSASGGGN